MVISMVKSIPNFGPCLGSTRSLPWRNEPTKRHIRIIIKKCTAKWHASTHNKMCKREWLTPAISNSQSSQSSKGFTKLSEVPILHMRGKNSHTHGSPWEFTLSPKTKQEYADYWTLPTLILQMDEKSNNQFSQNNHSFLNTWLRSSLV